MAWIATYQNKGYPMKKVIISVLIIVAITSSCNFSAGSAATESVPTVPATETQIPFTPIPTLIPSTPTPPAALGTIALDFVALLCNAQWMNGGQKFAACPDANSDHSAGYAVALDPTTEGLPANTTVLLTIPAINGYSALFLRYPTLKIQAGDRFRATLQCQAASTNCDVSFGLDYYDANGKYHSPLAMWDYKAGQAPINVDFDLSALVGQNVDIVLALRPNNDKPQDDTSLWIAPHIFRPGK
jgi:hypothetical protein